MSWKGPQSRYIAWCMCFLDSAGVKHQLSLQVKAPNIQSPYTRTCNSPFSDGAHVSLVL